MKRYIRSADELSLNERGDIAKYSADPGELEQLANDADEYVRRCVAENPNTPPDILAQLANDQDEYVRRCVADNPSAPADVLEQLANDADSGVKYYVAKNSNTPVNTLAQLANDENRSVRYTVADNSSTSTDVLAQLANDEDWVVRISVAKNSNTSADVLAQLANDEYKDIRKAAAKNQNTSSRISSKSSQNRKSLSSTIVVAYMNFDSTPMLSIVSASQLSDIRSQYEYVDTIKSKSGLIAVIHNNEDISIIKLAASEAAWQNSLKKYYESDVLPQFEEYDEAECYLFEDSWLFTIYSKEDCPDSDAYVKYCYNLIKDTYVDGDSYSNISIVDLSTMSIVVSGSDYISICEYDGEDF